MLLQIPQEVLFGILDFLAFQERLNLVKTCRYLRNVISERHLYEELPTFESVCRLRAALDIFKKYPSHGSQVKRITMRDTLYTFDISVELPSVFPTIKEFRTLIGGANHERDPDIKTLLPWKNTLEVLERGSIACICYLLKDHLFSHLSSLTVYLPFCYHDREFLSERSPLNFQRNIQLLDCFKNTPSLRHLVLYGLGKHLYVEHLEKLHEVCPQLTSLSIDAMHLHGPDIDTMPLNIEPATQLLSLTVKRGVQFYNLRNAVLEYFIAKYTRLTQLDFQGQFTDIRYLSGKSWEIYSDELVRERKWFISSLPATIKILKLNTDEFDEPLTALDESELEPTELAFYDGQEYGTDPSLVIKQPSQLRYLQSLKSLRSLTLGWDLGMEIDNIILGDILHLKVRAWRVMLDNNTYHLADIFSAYPSLKSLSVDFRQIDDMMISLTGTNHQSKEMVHANLRKLSMETHDFNPKVLEGISTLFPNLKELKLIFFVRPEGINSDIVINLDGCDLDILTLPLVNFESKYFYILVYLHVKSFDTLKIYRVNVAEERGINCITEISEGEDTATMNKIRITCDNIKMLNINDMDIKPF